MKEWALGPKYFRRLYERVGIGPQIFSTTLRLCSQYLFPLFFSLSLFSSITLSFPSLSPSLALPSAFLFSPYLPLCLPLFLSFPPSSYPSHKCLVAVKCLQLHLNATLFR